MKLVNPASLSLTLDLLNEAFFTKGFLWKEERYEAASWITGRQGLPGAYANTFAPMDGELKEGLTLFTGEKVTSRAGATHVLGEEACRALILLKAPFKEPHNALNHASRGLLARFEEAKALKEGMYCCPTCTCALWRHLAAGGLTDGSPEKWLAAGLKTLKARRLKDGKWKGFPFHYALLTLHEIDTPAAIEEMRHAAPVCERLLNSSEPRDIYAIRRRNLSQRVLAKC